MHHNQNRNNKKIINTEQTKLNHFLVDALQIKRRKRENKFKKIARNNPFGPFPEGTTPPTSRKINKLETI